MAEEKQILLKVDKEKYDAFKDKLHKEGTTVSAWFKELLEAELDGKLFKEVEEDCMASYEQEKRNEETNPVPAPASAE